MKINNSSSDIWPNLVSIIIPTYNRIELLIETLKSIRNQNYKYWECIIVDDGSSEANIELLKKFIQKDKRLKFLERKDFGQPKGANACRNIGIEEAIGDFIIFFDSDDLFLQNALEGRVNFFVKNPEYDFVVFQIESFFKDKTITPSLFTIKKDNYLHAFLSHSIPWPIMGPMFTASFLKKSVRFDLQMPRLQDPDFYTSLLLEEDIKFTVLYDRKPDMLYRANGSEPSLTNVLVGFNLYINKYSKLSANQIDSQLLKSLLKKCYFKAYQYFKIKSKTATIGDKKLILKLTFTAYTRDLLSTSEFITQSGKIIYFSIT